MSDVPIEVLRKRLWSGRIKDLVASVCERYPSCKGNYGLLLFRVYRELGVRNLRDFFDKMDGLPSPETVGRRFRELKEEDPERYRASLGTELKRSKNESVFREFYGARHLTDFVVVE
jgi:hypothetical protein